MLSFDTLTWVPIDRNLIDRSQLTRDETSWLNGYHADIVARISDRLGADARDWLTRATRAI